MIPVPSASYGSEEAERFFVMPASPGVLVFLEERLPSSVLVVMARKHVVLWGVSRIFQRPENNDCSSPVEKMLVSNQSPYPEPP